MIINKAVSLSNKFKNIYTEVKDDYKTTLDLTEETTMENNTTNIKSFHYLEDGSIEFSILETKYTTKKLEPKVYELSTKIVNNSPVPDLEVSTDNELFNNDLGFYYEDKVRSIYDKFFQK